MSLSVQGASKAPFYESQCESLQVDSYPLKGRAVPILPEDRMTCGLTAKVGPVFAWLAVGAFALACISLIGAFIAVPIVRHVVRSHHEELKSAKDEIAQRSIDAMKEVINQSRFDGIRPLTGEAGHNEAGYNRAWMQRLRENFITSNQKDIKQIKKHLNKSNYEAHMHKLETAGMQYPDRDVMIILNQIKLGGDQGRNYLDGRNLEPLLRKYLSDNEILLTPEAFHSFSHLAHHCVYQRNVVELSNACVQVERLLRSEPEGRVYDHNNQIRQKINAICSMPLYHMLNENYGSENCSVAYIRALAQAIRMESNGLEAFRAFGASLKQQEEDVIEDDGYGVALLKQRLDQRIQVKRGFSNDSIPDKIFTWVFHPAKAFHSWKGHQKEIADQYNSYQYGNADVAVGDFMLGSCRMRFAHGPTPTGDQLFRAHLEQAREKGGIHLQHNLQHPGNSGEIQRITAMKHLEEEFQGTMRLFSTPMDGVTWKYKEGTGEQFLEFSSVKDFYYRYACFAIKNQREFDVEHGKGNIQSIQGRAFLEIDDVHPKDDNGFYFGPGVLGDSEEESLVVFKQAFQRAQEAFSFLDQGIDRLDLDRKKRIARSLQVGMQGFVTVGAMVKTLVDSYPDERHDDLKESLAEGIEEYLDDLIIQASMGQACKQDIDRGVVLNVITRVYFQILEGKSLDDQDIDEIVGTVIGRAEMVDGRSILLDRYQPLSDFLDMVKGRETDLKWALKRYIKYDMQVDLPLKFQKLKADQRAPMIDEKALQALPRRSKPIPIPQTRNGRQA